MSQHPGQHPGASPTGSSTTSPPSPSAPPGAAAPPAATDGPAPALPETAATWLAGARDDVGHDPASVTRAFALAGRKAGRDPLAPATDPGGVVHGTVDDAVRAELVLALAGVLADRALAEQLTTLYQRGDTAERRGVLRGLDALTVRGVLGPPVVDAGVALAEDALRTNDQSLVAAAVGPFAARHLDQHTWRHAVLKLVFMGVSLDAVAGLDERHDEETARMARDFAAERRAAGRPVPDDVARLAPDVAPGAEDDPSAAKVVVGLAGVGEGRADPGRPSADGSSPAVADGLTDLDTTGTER